MKTSLTDDMTRGLFDNLSIANNSLAKQFPGESSARQPVHTVYGGAQLFKADSTQRLGTLAVKSLQEYAPNFVVFAIALQLPGWEQLPADDASIRKLVEKTAKDSDANASMSGARLAYTVYERVLEKLQREAVEDFRIDFEDGYGNRPDSEEDADAERTAKEVALGMKKKSLPPFIGIRIKTFTEELRARAVQTLDIFLTTLLNETDGQLPENFVVTLPKVTVVEQVTALVELFKLIENKNQLKPGSLKLELMVETTQSIINERGEIGLPALVKAAEGRCTGAHFGTYDYTASCSITAFHQSMDHPACDFARNVMKVSLAGTEVFLSDGATNIMPVGPNRARDGETLSQKQIEENFKTVHAAWKLSFDHVSHSLRNAFYQGWDLHPAQLPIRYAACYTFFLQGLDPASLRLRAFMEKAAQATLVGDVFDDAATGQGLLNYFLRALNCGAITEAELKATGLTVEEFRSRSFVKILANRRQLEKVLT
jgi:citrate lyase beta subunit